MKILSPQEKNFILYLNFQSSTLDTIPHVCIILYILDEKTFQNV